MIYYRDKKFSSRGTWEAEGMGWGHCSNGQAASVGGKITIGTLRWSLSKDGASCLK